MRGILEKFFPVLSKNETVVERTWNLSDLTNLFEICIFLLLKTILSTGLSFALEILKFILVLLLTYAFALGIFRFMETIVPEETPKAPPKKPLREPSEWQKGSSGSYPNVIDYRSKSDEDLVKTRDVKSNEKRGLESDTSEDEVVHVGSFQRASVAGEGSVKSTVGRAIDDLLNANISVNGSMKRKSRSFEISSIRNSEI